MKIPLSNPDITQKEIESVVAVLKTPDLSLGPKLPEFEIKFAEYIGSKHAVAVNSGTSALHLCMRALNINDGDEVITTPFSFISSANSILFERAKPVFVDIREDTLNINESIIEENITDRTRAILPVHVFGYPCDMAKIIELAGKRELPVVEDACEAIGASIDGKKAGNYGACSVFAFYPNKQMTTGEGGMIVTDNDGIAAVAKSLRNQGRDDGMGWLAHNRLGYNYRLSDINCALGIAQLQRIETILAKRAKVASLYAAQLADVKGVLLPAKDASNTERSWFVYVIRLSDDFTEGQRNKVIAKLRDNGIGCNCYFPPIHLQPFYVKQFGFKKGDFPMTEKVAERTIALPFFNNLSEEQVNYVVENLKKAVSEV